MLLVLATAVSFVPAGALQSEIAELVFDGEATTVASFAVVENARVDADAARTGRAGLRISSVDEPGYAQWDSSDSGSDFNRAAAEFWFRLSSRGAGESIDVLTIANAEGERNFDFFLAGDSQRMKWDIYRENAGESGTVDFDRWYFVEVTLSYAGTTHWVEVSIDGEDWGRTQSTGIPTTVESITFGSKAAKTHSQDYDDIVVRLSGDETEVVATPTAPTVTPAVAPEVRDLDYWRGWLRDRVRAVIDGLI